MEIDKLISYINMSKKTNVINLRIQILNLCLFSL